MIHHKWASKASYFVCSFLGWGTSMQSSVVKRSISFGGHRTSISLEDAFWKALRDIARRRRITLGELVETINANRKEGNLSSAIRLFCSQRVPGPNRPAPVETERRWSQVGRLDPHLIVAQIISIPRNIAIETNAAASRIKYLTQPQFFFMIRSPRSMRGYN